ncbi:MAG: tripartite tricarboxylate transporter TctB family protein [Pararhizobium sp.]
MLKNKDFCAGTLFVAFGVALLVLGQSLPKFTDGEIGPGGFPLIVSILLALVGGLTILSSLGGQGEMRSVARGEVRALVFVLVGVAAFALLIRPLGLIPAVLSLVGLSAFASRRPSPLRVLLSGCGLTVMSWLIFVVFLRLPVSPFNLSLLGG